MSLSKKYIVISREGGDFSMDLMFAGLVRRFGKENVIDYPARAKHRQGLPNLTGDDEKDYGAERRSLCYAEGCEDMKEWSRQEIIKEIFNGNIEYIFLDETEESYFRYMELFGFYSGAHPVVIVAGHDNFRGNHADVIKRYGEHHLKAMFIDDWKEEYNNFSKTHLINLSCNFDHLWDFSKRKQYLANKIYDICFIGYNSNRVRKIVIDHIKSKWSHLNNCLIFEEVPDKFENFVRHDEMFKLMAQSKICLNLPGASTCGRALRYYEIPYVGSYMITQWFPARLLYPIPAGVFDTLEELDTLIKSAIENEEERELKASKAHAHCMKYHTIDARLNYIFEVLDGQK